MNHPMSRRSRRAFLGTVATTAAFFTVKGAFAEQLAATPERTEGPFYPDKLPLDTDNDLIIINDSVTPAVGEITHLTGRILGPTGTPLKNVDDRDLAVRRQRGLPPHRRQRLQEGAAGQELPGVRPVHHRLDGRVSLPHHQARPVPRPARAAHPLQGEEGGSRAADLAVQHRRPPGQQARRDRPWKDSLFDRELLHGRFQADQRVEDRRARRELRHRPGPHPGRA